MKHFHEKAARIHFVTKTDPKSFITIIYSIETNKTQDKNVEAYYQFTDELYNAKY